MLLLRNGGEVTERRIEQHGRLVLRASVELVWRRAAVRESILL